jgi:hypothetical protein
VNSLCLHQRIRQPNPNGYQHDYSDRGEKVDAHTMIIFAFGAVFGIGDVPDGGSVVLRLDARALFRKWGDGYHGFTSDLPAISEKTIKNQSFIQASEAPADFTQCDKINST